MFILDGGMAKWLATGGAATKDATPAPKTGTFRVATLREEVRVRLPEFLVASGDPVNNALVEALEPDQHFGGAKFFDRAGHIPNAIMAPSADFFNPDKTFKSSGEIKRMLTYLGVKPEQQVYTHCGGGIAASVPFFATRILLNYPKVKLYKESQLEWLRDDRGLPFWTYDAPNMMREKLAEWMEQPDAAQLRCVKTERGGRAPGRGLPTGTCAVRRQHSRRCLQAPPRHPRETCRHAGAAGVNAAFEAVIVSDGGLNTSPALAFLMLEKLGQKKISVLAEGMDDWGLGGFTLTKEATIVGPRKSPQDLALPATTYTANVRPGILTGEPSRTEGAYPKVYIASGKALPAKVQDGKMIHVPYTELVNVDGTPKAAKDIWSIVVKAGLPRYAEIICVADDPGDAAANYFILKMLGYPDVKVLVT